MRLTIPFMGYEPLLLTSISPSKLNAISQRWNQAIQTERSKNHKALEIEVDVAPEIAAKEAGHTVQADILSIVWEIFISKAEV